MIRVRAESVINKTNLSLITSKAPGALLERPFFPNFCRKLGNGFAKECFFIIACRVKGWLIVLLLSISGANIYLHQNQSVQLGDGLDAVLHLVISHLNEAAVALLPHHGIHAVARHPGVHLDLLQLDSLSRILHQHLTDEGNQLRRQEGWCGDLTLLMIIIIMVIILWITCNGCVRILL